MGTKKPMPEIVFASDDSRMYCRLPFGHTGGHEIIDVEGVMRPGSVTVVRCKPVTPVAAARFDARHPVRKVVGL